MGKTGIQVMSPPRGYFSILIASVLVLCNVTLATQDKSAKSKRISSLKIAVLELHTTPNDTTPEDGFRESAPEEIQRIEQHSGRNTLPRNSSSVAWHWFPSHLSAETFCKPLLLVSAACLNANLIAVAHANLDSRYPIPPPAAL